MATAERSVAPVAGEIGRPRADAFVRSSDRLLALLERIDAMPDDATGALMLGPVDNPTGTVLVERGRICWATTPKLSRRLTDLLIERSAHPLERALFEAVFRRCRREGKPLGETLVAAEMVTRERFREALWLHTGEAIHRMIAEPLPEARFVAHRSARYAAEYSFDPQEALCGVGRAVAKANAPDAVADPTETFSGHLKTVVYADADCDGEIAWPIAVAGSEPLTCRELVELGGMARGILGGTVAHLTGATTQAFVATGGATVVSYREHDRTVVVLCADATAAARVFARRLAKG